jgi:DNA-binding CsgD family transcriptional regulator
LVIEGEPGIGKTTAWLQAVDLARERGFTVLTARSAAAETVVAYAALADLVGGVGASVFAELPAPQALAIDRLLLRAGVGAPDTEPRTVAAAFVSVIEALGKQTPVIVAIDDMQWLDPSSVFAMGFAMRRVGGRVGVVGTLRTGAEKDILSRLQLGDHRSLRRIELEPFKIGALSQLLSERLGRSFSRPAIVQIEEVSGGNPFYALELGRAMRDSETGSVESLPNTLSELVRARIDVLESEVKDLLRAMACTATPTIEVLAAATNTTDRTAELLEQAEAAGIVSIDGNRVRFTHPLLAHGVNTEASPASRRAMHRRLAAVVDQPELRARHLALGATSADTETLQALDAAAEMARSRGAPAAAAELLDLAINLGGDDAQRHIRSAAHHFESGNPVRARFLLEGVIHRLSSSPQRAMAANILATIVIYADGFGASATLLEQYLPEVGEDDQLSIEMLMALAYSLMNTGRKRECVQRINEAVARAERLGQPTLLSRALGLRVVLKFMCGAGVDEVSLRRALELDDERPGAPAPFQPRLQHALLMSWTGELEGAREELRSIERHRLENGEESEWIFIAYHRAMVEIWRGDFVAADRIAAETRDRAAHLDGDVALFSAAAIESALAAYAGRVEEARRGAQVALDASNRSEGRELGGWMMANLGFLEVSLGNYEAALQALQPIVDGLFSDPDYSEIIVASSVSDAVEAMVHLDRHDEADRLLDLIERNGRRLDRAWMLAVALRGRSMLLAARGDIETAAMVAEQAMVEHGRLPMPFERARTQLLLGQLQRRQRQKGLASETLQEALDTFERLQTPLWAERARAELSRSKVSPGAATLTPSEQRVAELAARGMTNRAIGAELFISPKTVDANLTRIYRKLGVHSRAGLARRMTDL